MHRMNNRGLRAFPLLLLSAFLLTLPLRAASWFPLGPFGGDARAFAADPLDSKHLYLGTATGWVYESHDGGSTWGRLSQISSRNDLVIDHILADKRNPRRLIVGAWRVTGVDGGIFISQDGGKTWFSQIEMNGQSVRSLARSSSNPNEVVAGTLAGVFRSLDNGIHWKPIVPEVNNGEIHNVQSIAIDPADPAVIYAGTWHLPWKTTDGGQNWIAITAKQHIIDDSDVFSILIDPADPKIVYASACSGIYKSVDAAGDFKKVQVSQGIPNTARRTRKLMQDPQHLNTVYAGTTEGLYRTLDGGDHWDRMTASDVIVNDVYVDPKNSNHVLLATDHGGVLLSDDEAATFQPSNTGFSARQVAAYASDPQNPALLYVGVVNDKETGGVFQSSDGGLRWQQQSTGLGGRDVFSLATTSEGVLLAGTNRGIYRLEAGTWVDSSELAGTTRARAVESRPSPKPPARKPTPHKTTFQFASRPHLVLAGLTVQQTATLPAHKPVKKPAHAPAKPASRSAKSRAVAHQPVARPKPHGPVIVPAVARVPSPDPAQAAAMPASSAAVAVPGPAQTPASSADRLSARVYALAAGETSLYAGTSEGLFRGATSGRTWTRVASLDLPEVRFISNRDTTLLASGLKSMALSADAGVSWKPISLPHGLTQVGALSLDGRNGIWVGGREGLFYSTDAGLSWQQLPNFSISQVDAIFYDASADRILATTAESTFVYSVHVPDLKLVYWDTGWKLRFARPVGDYLIGATLYDGVVVQPRMVESSQVTTKPQLPATPSARISAR